MNIPDRIYAQYRNKPKAVKWLNIVTDMITPLVNTADVVRKMYDIDTMVGEQLNIIGRIVVADRSFASNVEMFPGLFALTDGDEFGDSNAMFSALNLNEDSLMSDDLYRLVIKSKIIKNNSDATIESILDGVNFLLPNAYIFRLLDGENMSFSLEYYGSVSDLERWALLNSRLIPKPQGVRFNGFLEGFNYVEFDDDTSEFGDEESQFTGFAGALIYGITT
jgi:Protein of unknown function (DUF2612)